MHLGGAAGVRELVLPPMLKLLLLDWLDGRKDGWLFPAPKAKDGKGHRGPTFARGAIERVCKLAKLKKKDKDGNDVPVILTVHELRKTNARLDRQMGTQAERIGVGLGHESARITKQAYIGAKVEAEASGQQARDLIGEWLEDLATIKGEAEDA